MALLGARDGSLSPFECQGHSLFAGYGSLINVELSFGEHHSVESLGEDSHIFVGNRVNVYAKRFVEGFFIFNDHEIPDDVLKTVETRQDLRSLRPSWLPMT